MAEVYGKVSVRLNTRVAGPRSSSKNPMRWVMLAWGLPALPRLVRMMTTPFAAFEP